MTMSTYWTYVLQNIIDLKTNHNYARLQNLIIYSSSKKRYDFQILHSNFFRANTISYMTKATEHNSLI